MIAESTGLAQVEEHVASTGAKDSTLQTSTVELGTVEFVAASVASEATTIMVPEMPATISGLMEPVAGLVPAPSQLAPASVDIIHTTIERRFRVHQQSWLQRWTSWKN